MPDLSLHTPLTLGFALIVGIIATARGVRLVTSDTWPPVQWLRDRWEDRTTPGKWQELFTCPFCFAPYAAAIDGLWAWATDLAWWWWAPNLWLATAYLAAMLVVRDEPAE